MKPNGRRIREDSAAVQLLHGVCLEAQQIKSDNERLHALLRRVEATASTGLWRDGTGLSLNNHPLLDDIRAELNAANT